MVTVSQSGSLGGSRAVTLNRQPNGAYLSQNMLLAADAQDRTLDGIANAPPDASDRIFAVALEDTLTANYTHNGTTATGTATVGVDVKTLTVEVKVMWDRPYGEPCVTFGHIQADLKAMRERYAQVNVKVNWDQKPDFPAPPGIAADPTNWTVYTWDFSLTNSFLTADTRAIIDASNLAGTDSIRVIYVPPFKDGDGNVLAGYAISATFGDNGVDGAYIDTCFVTASNRTNYVPAHEVGHLLTLNHYILQRWNLMYYVVPQDYTWKDPRAIKRLDGFQQTIMHVQKKLGGTGNLVEGIDDL